MMFVWCWLFCLVVAVAVSAGELAQADSWLLMVEAGRDGPGRRITPKSVFIAPSLTSRSEKCRSGYRYDHLGRCVRVVRVDPKVQLDLLLKQLQLNKQTHTHRPYEPKGSEVSSGPLHFSLSLEPPVMAEATTIPPPTSLVTTSELPSSVSSPLTVPPTQTESTLSPTTLTTTATTLITREIHTKDLPTTTETPKESTQWEEGKVTSTTPLTVEEFGSGEGSGDENLEGSSSKTTEEPTWSSSLSIEGSGSESVTDSSTFLEAATVALDTSGDDEAPIEPNKITPSLFLEVLKGEELNTSADYSDVANTNKTQQQLPIVEYIDLFIPSKDEKEMAEVKETVLIPLDNIKFNITSKGNEVPSISIIKTPTEKDSPFQAVPSKNKTGPLENSPSWPWLEVAQHDFSEDQSRQESTSQATTHNQSIQTASQQVQTQVPNQSTEAGVDNSETSADNSPQQTIQFPTEPEPNPQGFSNQQPTQPEFNNYQPTQQGFSNNQPTQPEFNNRQQGFNKYQPTQPAFNNYRPTHPGFNNYRPAQPDIYIRPTQPLSEFSKSPIPIEFKNFRIKQHGSDPQPTQQSFYSQPTQPGYTQPPRPGNSKDSREKLFDNWWTETLPFDPTWIRFPSEVPQSYRKGPPSTSSKEYPPPTVTYQPSRFRFPEESVDPAHRPVILKFWSRIPMIKGESSIRNEFQSDEDQWTGP